MDDEELTPKQRDDAIAVLSEWLVTVEEAQAAIDVFEDLGTDFVDMAQAAERLGWSHRRTKEVYYACERAGMVETF